MESNPGPRVEHVKIDQILAYERNQEKEGKAVKQMLEAHKQEMSETNALGPKFDRLCEMVTEIMDYGQIKQAVRECEMRYQELENKPRQRDEGQRKNKREENYYGGQMAERISESRNNDREYRLHS
jgi:hypothetical protein